MNMIKRVGILLLVLALITATLVACGDPVETEDDWTPPTGDSESEGAEAPETEAPVDSETELTLPKDEF